MFYKIYVVIYHAAICESTSTSSYQLKFLIENSGPCNLYADNIFAIPAATRQIVKLLEVVRLNPTYIDIVLVLHRRLH